DDDDPRRNPMAQEEPGNGIDENCSGADADVANLGDRERERPSAAPANRPSFVVISIDALRADHLGAYGYRRPTSPAIDALAAGAVRFGWAVTSCPATHCAIPSLHTGRYASTLRGERDKVANMATLLRAAGWDTKAITCCD